MKIRLRIKQVIKMSIHSIFLVGWGTIIFIMAEAMTGKDGVWLSIQIFALILLSISAIIYHIFFEWLLEHTPLKTNYLKKRVHHIKDEVVIHNLTTEKKEPVEEKKDTKE